MSITYLALPETEVIDEMTAPLELGEVTRFLRVITDGDSVQGDVRPTRTQMNQFAARLQYVSKKQGRRYAVKHTYGCSYVIRTH